MFWHWKEAIERIQDYVAAHNLTLNEELGRGYDGIVYATT